MSNIEVAQTSAFDIRRWTLDIASNQALDHSFALLDLPDHLVLEGLTVTDYCLFFTIHS
jgi:hypothetical protein